LNSWVTGQRRSVSATNRANCSSVASDSTVARTGIFESRAQGQQSPGARGAMEILAPPGREAA
jgi:hypothetical protein